MPVGDQNTSSVSKRVFVFIIGLCQELVLKRVVSEAFRLEQISLPSLQAEAE